MDRARWQAVKQIFAEAEDRPACERGAFVAEACGGDEELRRQVEALLGNADGDDDFLSAPLLRLAEDELEPALAAGSRIGPYEILRELGAGGMGVVYLAARADDVYRKQVAIKLMRGGSASTFVARRFRHERQILAALEHPNIARLLDGGATADGQPYFVMEYVQGEPITAYCDGHLLPVAERVRLFLDACAAVEYAHRHLVVHRDLKPGNLLVSAEGVVKLLDFGIAKLLAPDANDVTVTATSVRLMTPEYASPEQVRGETITTASDIYALGVILYGLLTGQRPYRTETHTSAEMERAVCEEEPLRPSAAAAGPKAGRLRKQLAGDLDTILLMALRKEPARRYASVERFADDLRRYLAHQPVRAQRDTLRYRTGKFLRRHTGTSVAVGLLFLSMAGGMAATAWQARIARAERARAVRRFQDVRKLANSFLFEFHDAIEALPGSTPARELVVRRALEYLNSLSRESGDDPGLLRELATAYQKVGDVQGNPSLANLGDTTGALRSHRAGLELRERLAARAPDNMQACRELSSSHDRVGDLLWFQGDRAGALAEYRQAMTIREELWQKQPDAMNGHLLSWSYNNVGDVLGEMQSAGAALESYRHGLAIAEGVAAANPNDPRAARDLSVSHNRIGDRLWYQGQLGEAMEHYRKALVIRERLALGNPASAVFQRDVMASHNNIGDTLTQMKRPAEALESYRNGLAVAEALAAADPRNAQAARDLGVGHRNVGTVLLATGGRRAAELALRRALALFETLAARDPSSAIFRQDIADTRRLLAPQ